MNVPPGARKRLVPLLVNITLIVVGVGIALGLMELLLRSNPNWVPSQIRVNPPTRRVSAFLDETYNIKLSDGDLFHWMKEDVAPLPPEEDEVVARVHMLTDVSGFRNSPPEKATYEIVALGDSFTKASGVATSWPQKLAEYIGSDVLNLGDVGFGPQDELKVLRQYGLKKQPHWVIMAYFEGNDLYDAAAYEQANPFILTRFARLMFTQGLEALQNSSQGGAQAAIAPSYRYPIRVTINYADMDLTFFSSYISWLSISGESIERSQNYTIVRETIIKARDLSKSAGVRYLLVFVPSKEHVYLPYLDDPKTLAKVYSDVPMLDLDEAGFIQFIDQKVTPESVDQHMDDQANLLAEFAAEQDISFLDLTSYFQKEADAGAELYYPYDTHWNQIGHDLAAEAIARFMKDMLSIRDNLSR
jgi:SGNH hydrolase-like domain, acetyltransferase AlgX